MTKKVRILNVMDLEGTCWEDGIAPDGKEQREVSEITEIGIVQIDMIDHKILKKESYIIKPTNYPILSQYAIDLTGITQEMVDNGMTLKYAGARLMSEFGTMKHYWASWGIYDRRHVEREFPAKGFQNPFTDAHINIKHLLSLLTGQARQRNVPGMLEYLGMKFEGKEHSGVDDAYNEARMLLEVLRRIKGEIK